jgi:hypothetical protein
MTTTTLPVVFRPVRTRAVLMGVGTVTLSVFTVIALLLPAGGARPWGVADRLTLIGAGALAFAVLALLGRPKVMAGEDGVTVVNITTRRTLAWAEVVRVNLHAGDPWVRLDLADGTSLAVMGIQPGIAREWAVRDAASLRALAETYGIGEPTPR